MAAPVDLVIPLKSLHAAKSRLFGALVMTRAQRSRLVLAMAMDTVAAAVGCPGIGRVLVAAARPDEVAALGALGAEVVGDGGAADLNQALRHVEALVRADDGGWVVGALNADLPALRPSDLATAIDEAAGRRAFCPDRTGTGTSLLLSAAGQPLRPRFGWHSARAHTDSGAVSLSLPAANLRTDVDTPADLARARLLGIGRHTRAVLNGDVVHAAFMNAS